MTSSSASSSSASSSSSLSSSGTEESSGTWAIQAPSSPPVLVYYEDEAMTVQKGIIDLDNCEEIVDHVESCYYRHLFLLKATTQRGRQRTYYLAADSSDDVTNWVKKLHSALNLYEDKLFTNRVLSITQSGSDVTGIIATVSKSEVHSETSKTNATKKSGNESFPEKATVKQLSHVHCLIVNSQTPPTVGLCVSNSEISVSKWGTKVTDRNLGPASFQPDVSTDTRSNGSVSVDVESSSSSSGPPCQPSALRNEAPSGNACNEQAGAEYGADWPQLVKKLLDDEDECQGTEERDKGGAGKVEGQSVFYFCNESSFSQDTKANPNNAHEGQRPNLSGSSDETQELPSPQPSCYLRITQGSRRYKRGQRRVQDIPAQF